MLVTGHLGAPTWRGFRDTACVAKLTILMSGDKCHLVKRDSAASTPVFIRPVVHIAFGNGIVGTPKGWFFGGWVGHGQKDVVIRLCLVTRVHFGHFAVHVDQFERLNVGISCAGVKFPAHVVADGTRR